jgi:hypothetical protein
MKRALGCWKSEAIMSTLQEFVDKVRDRIRKESAMPLDTAEKTLASPRFQLLFCMMEFASYVERLKLRKKEFASIKPADLEDPTWKVRCFKEYYNCAGIFAPPLPKNPLAQAFVRSCVARLSPPPGDDGPSPDTKAKP